MKQLWLIRWLPNHQLDLLLTAIWGFGMIGVIWVYQDTIPSLLLLATMELLLPSILSILAAGLIINDPVLDILLSVSQPIWHTIMQRFLLICAIAGLLGVTYQILANTWVKEMPILGWQQTLIWGAPTLFYMGLATIVAIIRGYTNALVVALGFWGVNLLSLALIPTACRSVALNQTCWSAVISPVLTLLRPQDPNWLLNRFIWLSIGLLCLLGTLVLARREERLITAASLS